MFNRLENLLIKSFKIAQSAFSFFLVTLYNNLFYNKDEIIHIRKHAFNIHIDML